ncbi:NAD(P)H-hydrate dehydratase [Candidatus Pacearchaeota archaeon]|nr:NAD(P)H-hydrate dehydratase [Candidatus Pacearchaeota archaeon]
MKAISVQQMKELDQRSIKEAKIPSFVLMERAGFACGEKIIEFIEDRIHLNHVKRFVIITGKGNNGGDAYVVARYLYENTDINIIIYSICDIEKFSPESQKHAGLIIEDVDYSIKKKITENDFSKGDIIIDGLLGTGISGSLKKPYDSWIKTVNSTFLTVISLDVPSGMDADNGTFKDDCIMADMTITIALPKRGLVENQGPEYCGRLRCVDIGIPQEYIDETESDFDIYFSSDAKKSLSRLPMKSYKNSLGSVLVIGGSKEYYGAPFLAALSAQRSGAGIVRVAVPESIEIIPDAALSLIVAKINDTGKGYFCMESLKDLKPLIDKSDIIILGPGIGTQRDTFLFVREILKTPKPVIIDADALNIIAESPEIYHRNDSNILTPHPGEMKRLLEAFELESFNDKTREEKATALAGCLDATIVFKGSRTIIASPDGQITVNSSGCPALATAGSGDSLTGIIAALNATAHEDYYHATAAAVFIHGMTGEISPFGNRGFIADDIQALIPEAMLRISPFA